MKNRNIIFIIILICVCIVINILYLFDRGTIDSNIFNKTWYRYDFRTGYYEKIIFDEKEISYYKPMSVGQTSSYDKCSSYNYNIDENTYIIDCGKKISVLEVKENKITLNIDDNIYCFFNNIDDSLNYEFTSFFNMSMTEYKEDKINSTEVFEIDFMKFRTLYKTNEYSKIVFVDKKCETVDCITALDLYEKWVSLDSNIYFIDVNKLVKEDIRILNLISKDLTNIILNDTSMKPYVIVIKNRKILDQYEIDCKGFDCTSYYGV